MDGESLYRLAMAHIYGDGVAEDNVLAAKLLTEARALGHVEAAYNLGICYHYGYGVDVDLETAYGCTWNLPTRVMARAWSWWGGFSAGVFMWRKIGNRQCIGFGRR